VDVEALRIHLDYEGNGYCMLDGKAEIPKCHKCGQSIFKDDLEKILPERKQFVENLYMA